MDALRSRVVKIAGRVAIIGESAVIYKVRASQIEIFFE
jgi:hypothetical protein